ncbi:MAG TPA: 2-amino-4-hydroxy-6-hydroxymethyldihydropteridine diphosphokinase [Pseudomonadales bacterium]|nr:2-amino-4-hydroxy-6-hydroxymethyldihydropteridine diphosphokinase [Pseudomonadales bacterium]
MVQVYIALGSNVEPEKNIPLALQRLRESFPDLRVSPIYRCDPVGFSGGYFWNLVASFSTAMPLLSLADQLRELEFAMGREPDAKKNSARTLDVDILLYGDSIGQFGRVTLPREDIVNYAFVLKPLVELAPDLVHPQLKQSITDLYQHSSLDFSGLQAVTL